jgi:hypothetical protein
LGLGGPSFGVEHRVEVATASAAVWWRPRLTLTKPLAQRHAVPSAMSSARSTKRGHGWVLPGVWRECVSKYFDLDEEESWRFSARDQPQWTRIQAIGG